MAKNVKMILLIAAAVFLVLAVIFYVSSVREVGSGSNSIKVANIQSTVFAAASAILCGINVVAYLVVLYFDGKKTGQAGAVQASGVTHKPEPMGMGKKAAPGATNVGSWICPNCAATNTRSRVACQRCGTVRPEGK